MELGVGFLESDGSDSGVVLISKKAFQELDKKKSTFRPATICLESDEPIAQLVYGLLATALLACRKDAPEAAGVQFDFLRDLFCYLYQDKEEEELEFPSERLDRVLFQALGCGAEKKQKKIISFINSEDMNNFSPWVPKIRDSDAKIPEPGSQSGYRSFYAGAEFRAKPALGITSQSFGYQAVHLVRNNKGTSIDFLLNAKIDIDGIEYPLQTVLTGQVAPGNFRYLPENVPQSLQCLANAVKAYIERSNDFGMLQEIPGGTFRTIALDFAEDPVEISPVTSVDMVDFVRRYLEFYSNRRGTINLTVGDGNAINAGVYASNVNGNICLLAQPDPNLIQAGHRNSLQQLEWELLRLRRGVLSRKLRVQYCKKIVFKKHGKLNKKDWDTVLDGLEKVMELYLQKINSCFRLYEELVAEGPLSSNELEQIWPVEWPDIKKLVVEFHYTEANIRQLAERIFSDTYGSEIELSNCGDFTVNAIARLKKLIWSRRGGYVST